MTFTGFSKDDFHIFQIEGFSERMDRIKEQIQPKLTELGTYFTPVLSAQLGEEMYFHVAKHARRTVNPPKDTWVAFSDNRRGYKMRPHFQIGLWETHLFIWFAIIYEAPNKPLYAKRLLEEVDLIFDKTKKNYVWSQDHTKPDVIKHKDMSKDDLVNMLKRLETVKKGELLCGYQILQEEVVEMSGDELLAKIEEVFTDLIYLYRKTLDLQASK